jgi:hypothetical protein
MTKPYLLFLIIVLSERGNSQTFNYDRYAMGFSSHLTFYQPRSFNTANTFIYDKGNLAGDWSAFYSWKKRSIHTVFAGIQTRLSEFKDSISFQSRDKSIEIGILIGKRMYIVDHRLSADYNMGTSVRKLINRDYLFRPDDIVINSYPKSNSFTNSITGTFIVDMRINFEFLRSVGILFFGLSGGGDMYQVGNSNFNRYSNKFSIVSLNLGFTALL